MRYLFVLLFILSAISFTHAQVDWNNYDVDELNKFITIEVNKLRRKEKVDTLKYQPLLLNAAKDHSEYMLEKKILTHYQKNKKKKTPKNRVDFYGEQFASVGENVQVLTLNSIPKQLQKKGEPRTIDSYEWMAKILVLNWKNSPPHFANMIHPDYSGTLTAISIGSDGTVYACQLFSNEPFIHPKKNDALNFIYKPDKNTLSLDKVTSSNLRGAARVLDDGSIYFSSDSKKQLRKIVRNPWRSGIAADIVLKHQYVCGTNNAFNGKRGVRGIPMNPVFRKSFKEGENIFKKKVVSIYLGKVPEWIDDEYEINLTIVKKKRTLVNHKFFIIPLEFRLNLDMQPIIDAPFTQIIEVMRDTVTMNVSYAKSDITFNPDSLKQLLAPYHHEMNERSNVFIRGASSIEGTREINEKLYLKRAENISSVLVGLKIDSTKIKVAVAENFEDFRKDIKGTRFEFLNKWGDEELRKEINEKWSDSLEPILKHHRYATLTMQLEWNDTVGLDMERLTTLFNEAMGKSDVKKAGRIVDYVVYHIQKGALDAGQLQKFTLPETKTFVYQHFQKLLIEMTDSMPWKNSDFVESVYQLVLLNPSQKEVKTYYYWLLYNQTMNGFGFGYKDLFDNLIEQKNVDRVLASRMLVSIASVYDELLTFSGVEDAKEYLHASILPIYKRGELTDDENVLLAQYFYYFGYYSEVKSLLRRGISAQSSMDDIVTYLKIMHDDNMGLSEKQYFNLFVQVAEWKKEEFCTIFNSPKLNFQVMDDQNIKDLYCKKCR
jgi:uncharacterized protein YkwD